MTCNDDDENEDDDNDDAMPFKVKFTSLDFIAFDTLLGVCL